MSGPVLDRLDLQIEVPALLADELTSAAQGEPSAVVLERVIAGPPSPAGPRRPQHSVAGGTLLRGTYALDAAGLRLIRDAVDRGGMSARGVFRALRVPRTIADLEDEERVTALRLAEALQYRAQSW